MSDYRSKAAHGTRLHFIRFSINYKMHTDLPCIFPVRSQSIQPYIHTVNPRHRNILYMKRVQDKKRGQFPAFLIKPECTPFHFTFPAGMKGRSKGKPLPKPIQQERGTDKPPGIQWKQPEKQGTDPGSDTKQTVHRRPKRQHDNIIYIIYFPHHPPVRLIQPDNTITNPGTLPVMAI